MAATIQIREKNTALETNTDKTSGTIRFKAADNASADLADPIVRLGSGTAFSYEKMLQLFMSVAPSGAITSPRAFSDGTNNLGTGIDLYAGVISDFRTPVVTDSADATTDFFSYTSPSSVLDLDTNNPGPFDNSDVGLDFADVLVMQADVADTASPGLTSAETLTIAYDET